MYSGTPPFSKADKKEPYYKLLCTNKHDTFWKAHSKSKPEKEKYYSENFRDMVNKMLSYNAKDRLTLEQLLAHPWL